MLFRYVRFAVLLVAVWCGNNSRGRSLNPHFSIFKTNLLEPRTLASDDPPLPRAPTHRPRRALAMADQNEVDLDSIIERLLEVRGSRPGKPVQLLEQEIRYLCTKAREIFISQPILLELEAPIKVRERPVGATL